MYKTFSDFEKTIISRQNLYPWYRRFLGRQRPEIRVFKVLLEDGAPCKLLALTPAGRVEPWQSRLAQQRGYLEQYAATGLAPRVVAGDDNHLAVEWTDGVSFSALPPGERDFAQLARCVCRGFIPGKKRPVEKVAAGILDQARFLREHELLDRSAAEQVERLLAGDGLPRPPEIAFALSFSDPGWKNFLRDREGNLKYIDIFGIQSKPAGLALARHYMRVPRRFRPRFREVCVREKPELTVPEHLPFYLLWYFIRIPYQAQRRRSSDNAAQPLRRRRRDWDKIQKRRKWLFSFLRAAEAGPDGAAAWCRCHRL